MTNNMATLWKGLDFKRLEVVEGNVKVDLDWFLEGRGGNYDHTNPNDAPLLRFTVQRRIKKVPVAVAAGGQLVEGYRGGWEWEDVDNGSYCTKLRATAPRDKLQWAAQLILDIVAEPVEKGESVKKLCRRLSLITAEGLTLRVHRT